ncbi:hypothetical protein [Streptomyces nojiriensis]|nr:hypothetical protein [Streptomyces nojiriensis]QTI50295.1 hypothetical protein JYK04_08172 [Streptomyces nojiriensis]
MAAAVGEHTARALPELRRRLGSDVMPVPWLDAAMDADRIIAAALDGEAAVRTHPLAR